jgi:hypothetical protein
VDRRDELTWRNRFNDLHNRYPHRALLIDRWWNFYSSGEEVLRNAEDNTTFVNLFTHTQNNKRHFEITGQFGWAIQERIKGLGPETGLPYYDLSATAPLTGALGIAGAIAIPHIAEKMGGTYGGWKFNNTKDYWSKSPPTPLEVGMVWHPTTYQIFRAHPIFDKGPSELAFLYDPEPNLDTGYRVPTAFFIQAGHNGYNLNKLLADAIPATSFPVGSNKLDDLDSRLMPERNIDLNNLKEGGANGRWPEKRGMRKDWRHSDLKDVAYFFTYKAYDQLAEQGDLK